MAAAKPTYERPGSDGGVVSSPATGFATPVPFANSAAAKAPAKPRASRAKARATAEGAGCTASPLGPNRPRALRTWPSTF